MAVGLLWNLDMKNFIIVAVLGLFLVACDGAKSTEQARQKTPSVEKLQQICDDLTKNSPDRHVYKAVVGRYLGSKTYSEHMSDSQFFLHHMILKNKDTEYHILVDGLMENYDEFFQYINVIVGQEFQKKPTDTEESYGICAKKNGEFVTYSGQIKTFQSIEE